MPVCYEGNPGIVIGHEETILWPSFADRLDFELESEFYLKQGRHGYPQASVEEYIAGNTIFNDIAAYDILRNEMMCGS